MDVRKELAKTAEGDCVTAAVVTNEGGIVAGTKKVLEEVEVIQLKLDFIKRDGDFVHPNDEVCRFSGNPEQISIAEERIIGWLSKSSGIATSAYMFRKVANGRVQIVSGGWKKMPPPIKDMVRDAVHAGGLKSRMVEGKFVYLDKNWVNLLGGIEKSLEAVRHLDDFTKIIQIRGKFYHIAEEACKAVEKGANIVFVDTGNIEDLRRVVDGLRKRKVRDFVKIAFGGGVTLEMINDLLNEDVDIIDVGRKIIDAPMLDIKLEIRGIGKKGR